MKVWLVSYLEYGDVTVYSEDTDMLKVPAVVTELSYLEDEYYADERDTFLRDVEKSIARGFGDAEIEERIRVELVEVASLDSDG